MLSNNSSGLIHENCVIYGGNYFTNGLISINISATSHLQLWNELNTSLLRGRNANTKAHKPSLGRYLTPQNGKPATKTSSTKHLLLPTAFYPVETGEMRR